MTDITIRIDGDYIRSAVQAKVRPAVESVLAEVDIVDLVKAELLRKPEQPSGDRERYAGLWMMMHSGGKSESAESSINQMVRETINEIAKEYVSRHIRAQRDWIEAGLAKMMTKSSDSLVRAFAKAAENALAEDWAFKLDVEVTHKESGADDD